MSAAPSQPTFRFAPSPNGLLHLGHALSALINHDLAQAKNGRLLLRIEDIDPARSKPEFVEAIAADLAWLGLTWEQPVRHQSQHMAAYALALDRLERRGLLYACFCTRGDLARTATPNMPRDPDGSPLYPGTCRALSPRQSAHRQASGLPYALRINMAKALACAPPGIEWHEVTATGAIQTIPATPARWGDAIIARKDVPASYHLCVVVDDALQGVTDVVRGQDLASATHMHRLLQALLALPTPVYRHHRLILDTEGDKLAKSRLSQPLRALRAAGHSADDIRRRVGL